MMREDTSRGTFEDVVRSSMASTVDIAYHLRDLIAEVLPEVMEYPRPAEQHVGYGIGAGKANEIFAYICPVNDYVRLGFYYGSSLPDPAGLLVGEGKRLRHIKVFSISGAERPEIRQLLEAAYQERKNALGIGKPE